MTCCSLTGMTRRTVTTALLAIEPFASHPEILVALEDPVVSAAADSSNESWR